MKRFLFTASIAFITVGMFSSCQKEDMSALELTRELTAELQKVVDYPSAEAAAPRIEALNQRFQNATVRPFALNGTALLKTAGSRADSDAFVQALDDLAREMGRLQASVPTKTYDGDVDQERLLKAVAEAQGTAPTAPAAALRAAGSKYLQNDSDKTHEVPGTFPEYYGSAKLKEALAYIASSADVEMVETSVAEIPAPVEPAEVPEEEEAPAAADADGAEEATNSDSTSESTTPPAEEESGAKESAEEEDGLDPFDDGDSGDDSSSDEDDTLEIDL